MPRNPNKINYSKGFPHNLSAFEQLQDPRSGGNTKHHFGVIIAMAFTSLLCGVSCYRLMESFCRANQSWFKKWLSLPNGTPSDDTFSRVFESIDPEYFAQCIIRHLEATGIAIDPQQLAIDGKSLRGSSNTQDNKLHAVSAWACDAGITIAQVFTEEKSNEITAIPELLKQLNIKDSIITIDAMGTQVAIANAIIDGGAHYILSAKKNQPALFEEIHDQFLFASKSYNKNKLNVKNWGKYQSNETSRGREEQRSVIVCNTLGWMNTDVRKRWKNLKSVIMVERKTILENGSCRKEVAFYISSLESPNPKEIHDYIRNHWAIENSCHWVIDVVFREDANQVSKRNSAKNLSIMRRIVHNKLKYCPETTHTKTPDSLPMKQMVASQDLEYREQCLGINP